MDEVFQDEIEQQKKNDKFNKRIRNRELNDLRHVLKDAEGRRFIWRLLSWALLFKVGFVDNPHKLYFNEGARELGMKIFHEVLNAKPGAYELMQREAQSLAIQDQKELEELNHG